MTRLSDRQIRVEASRWGYTRRGRRTWKVIDNSGPKVFTRVFVFSTWWAAMRAADSLSRGQRINPWGLLSVHTDRPGRVKHDQF